MSDEDSSAIAGVMAIGLVLAFVVCWFVFGESPKDAAVKAKSAVEDSGYTNVEIMDRTAILACDSNDVYRMRWKGTSQNGKEVKGQACAGWFFKGWTVRLER